MQYRAELTAKISSSNSLSPVMAAHYRKRRSDVCTRVVEGEMVVLDRQVGLIHQLNQTASYIWERCDGICTMAAITYQLAEAFDVDRETAAKDVEAIVSQLEELNLLEPRSGVTVLLEP